MTSSSVLHRKLPVCLTTTREPPSHLGKSKLLSVSCFLESWPNTPCQKEPRQSPNTLHPSKRTVTRHKTQQRRLSTCKNYNPKALLRATTFSKEQNLKLRAGAVSDLSEFCDFDKSSSYFLYFN